MIRRLVLIFCFVFGVVINTTSQTVDWTLYPNPAKTYFNISTAGELLPYVDIYNYSIQLVREQYIGTGQRFVRVDVHGLKPGSYIVCMKDDSGFIK